MATGKSGFDTVVVKHTVRKGMAGFSNVKSTQSHQNPFQECWSVSVIHKLPNSTSDHIRHQFQTAYQLLLQSHHTPGLNIPLFHPRPTALTIFVSLLYSTAEEGFHFLTMRAQRCKPCCLSKCHSAPPIIFIIIKE